jgi:hypothetical protein
MASELKFLIDNLDRGQPLNPEDFGINITEDDAIGARIVSFDNELIFGGDVFSYLYDKLAASGYCELVRVSVQYLCSSGTWERLVDGYLIVTECNFILDRCQVKTKLYDETFSTKINNNKSIPFSLELTTSKNGVAITPPTKRIIRMFTPSTGITNTVDTPYCYAVYDVFAHLVACMSDGLVDFDSNYFSYQLLPFQLYPTYIYTTGLQIRSRGSEQMLATFETIYNALRLKFNLGMGFEKQANGRPLLRIEQASYFQQATASVSLFDQSDIEMKFDTSRLYASVEFGNNPYREQGECDGGATPCTFTQTPFRGFRNETFGFVGECNTANTLNLNTSEVVFDTNAIEDIFVYNTEDFDLNPVVIQAWFFSITLPSPANIFSAQKFDPLGVGQSVYNGDLINENVSANWISGYPNTLTSFFQKPPSGAANTTRLKGGTSTFNVNNTGNTYSGVTGDFVPYFQVLNQGGSVNVVNNRRYICPFVGRYTVIAYIARAANPTFPTPKWVRQYLISLRLDSADNEIQRVNGNSVTLFYNTFTAISFVSATYTCNIGDKLVLDFYAQGQGLPNVNIPIALIGGNNIQFTVLYEPFLPTELTPVDINDVQAYLYKFKRPLSMAEINAITSETSKPILLGRKDDALAVSPTYIKNIQIESVMRKGAQFELRSNKLLP